jgi:protein-S-isoprenylcysteine O-methyltransferase
MFNVVFTTVFILWGVSEIYIGTRLRTKGDSERDAGTLKFVLIAAYASIGVAAFIALRDDGVLAQPTLAGQVGLAAIILGIALRAYAILTLRRFFTVNVTLREGHRLIRTGPYRFVRHPAYTGTLLSFYGLALALENIWAAAVLILPITVAFAMRMRVEEAVLRNAFPTEYSEYERTTRRLVPFIY